MMDLNKIIYRLCCLAVLCLCVWLYMNGYHSCIVVIGGILAALATLDSE